MDQQERLESQYRSTAAADDLPKKDPFPRMIIICMGISLTLLMVIFAVLFVDFIIIQPDQNFRQTPVVTTPAVPANGAETR